MRRPSAGQAERRSQPRRSQRIRRGPQRHGPQRHGPQRRGPRRRAVAAAVLLAVATTACGSEGRTLNVFAAASLTEPFGELEQVFEQRHQDVDVRLNLAGSSTLGSQIAEGAPADVFASANEPVMADVAGDLGGEPHPFATNRLTIAVPPGNPAGIEGFGDLAGGGATVVVCQPQVPCGAAAGRLAKLTGTTLRPASEEQDVKDVLNKVVTREADAGLVYATDVRAAGDQVDEVGIPGAGRAANRYPIAVTARAAEPELAAEFRDLVLGEEGRRVLRKAGFGTP
ncbi:molybdate ABC transporter substrate-binding protein [Prauserella halophila]|uniref:Molybdate ABC transporter substrate-binding protein n=1 Tax=Prauserella halophila TaxID=185641 RepID=A0ABN1W8W1_9PSEU|nr:molybdate ABC transporter substrate-binding protein [Prauserella halophila]MCP2235637.1 molybdate transport system substrate-binding protein [Prauserella halophila]